MRLFVIFLIFLISMCAYLLNRPLTKTEQIQVTQKFAKGMLQPDFPRWRSQPKDEVTLQSLTKLEEDLARSQKLDEDKFLIEATAKLTELKKSNADFASALEEVKSAVDCFEASELICAWIAVSIPGRAIVVAADQQLIASEAHGVALAMGESLMIRLKQSTESISTLPNLQQDIRARIQELENAKEKPLETVIK